MRRRINALGRSKLQPAAELDPELVVELVPGGAAIALTLAVLVVVELVAVTLVVCELPEGRPRHEGDVTACEGTERSPDRTWSRPYRDRRI